FDVVHSVDSVRLAETLDRQVREAALASPGALDPRLPILLQINVSGEVSKEGFALPGGCANKPGLEALLGVFERIVALPGLEVRGLMTIAPLVDDPELARPTFRMLRELRDELARQVPTVHWNELSMGMTDDFEVAISEGATLVRVGRALFGER
ncbi:MAG: YggS family pyridoxal phosphate-dependent enzyme, partial [Chloroflexia bacterium]|nr:YggS family pyridoxal phosphate-dependent enzyme [Chloroflexia bacterium]